jgi:hypothetical protein
MTSPLAAEGPIAAFLQLYWREKGRAHSLECRFSPHLKRSLAKRH